MAAVDQHKPLKVNAARAVLLIVFIVWLVCIEAKVKNALNIVGAYQLDIAQSNWTATEQMYSSVDVAQDATAAWKKEIARNGVIDFMRADVSLQDMALPGFGRNTFVFDVFYGKSKPGPPLRENHFRINVAATEWPLSKWRIVSVTSTN
jgi:hypothetical protein